MTDVVRGPDAGIGGIETGSLPSIHRVDPASCTSLELDRVAANRTVVRPCPSDGLALRLTPAPTARIWRSLPIMGPAEAV